LCVVGLRSLILEPCERFP